MRNIFYSLTGIMLLLGITACSEEERYATSVVKEIQLFLDDEPWAVNTGASNKPLFIYTADGEYVANYSSLYRFQLANGSYNIISTTQSDSISATVDRISSDKWLEQSTITKSTISRSSQINSLA